MNLTHQEKKALENISRALGMTGKPVNDFDESDIATVIKQTVKNNWPPLKFHQAGVAVKTVCQIVKRTFKKDGQEGPAMTEDMIKNLRSLTEFFLDPVLKN